MNNLYKKNKKIFTLLALASIIAIYSILFVPQQVIAQQSCSEKYPDGLCATECPEGINEDTRKNLCPTGTKCCHELAASTQLKLQIPLLTYTEANNIYEYIGSIYTVALYIIVPIAIVIIMFGGFQWLSSLGNSEQIRASKNIIMRGLIGLGIALLSYTILSFVGITELKMPGIEAIEAGPDEFMEIIKEAEGSVGATYTSVAGQCFPVAKNSYRYVSWNFGARRSSGARCHAGIDIFTKSPGHVVAIADGVVTSVGHFYKCKSGWSGPGGVDRIFINHGNFSVNYGEIDKGKIATGIKPGVQVKAGQLLGVAGHCGMLHIEFYQGNVSNNLRWYPPKGKSVGSGNYCRTHFMSTKPAALLDPTNTIKELQSKMCGN